MNPDPLDLDLLQSEAVDNLTHLASLGTYTSSFSQQCADLLEIIQYSCLQSLSTEKKIEEIHGEISHAREMVGVFVRGEEESLALKKGVENVIDDCRKKTEAFRADESSKKNEVTNLNDEIMLLKNRLLLGSGWTGEQEAERKNLMLRKDHVFRNLDNVKSVLKATRLQVDLSSDAIDRLQSDNDEIVERVNRIEGETNDRADDTKNEVRKKSELEEKLHSLQSDVKVELQTLISNENNLKTERLLIVDTDAKLRDSKTQMEKYLHDYDILFRETQKITEELEMQIRGNDVIDGDNLVKKKAVDEKVNELKELLKDTKKIVAAREFTVSKINEVDLERVGFEKNRDDLKLEIEHLTAIEIKQIRKEGEALSKTLSQKNREKEILTRKQTGSEKSTALIASLQKVNENSTRNLQNEMTGFMTSVKLQRLKIETLVLERERFETDVELYNQKHYTSIEELKLQEVQITDLQKKIIDGGSRLKQQQNLYEAVRSDRNLYSKNLIESQDEICEMKRRFKVMNHQIEQLKDEITSKDHALVKEHFNHHNVDKERETLRNELTKIRKQILSSEQIIANQKVEVQKLSQIIQEADEERNRQRKEYDAVMSERDILGNQLIKRNDELTKLYEKVKVQRSVLHHGELQYQDRIAEINHLSKSLYELKREKLESVQESSNQDELRRVCLALEHDLLAERTKIKALSEELDRPLNVHRWRHLESSDPSRYEMIRKIQSLQKRLIQKTEEVMEKDSLIQEKEKLYVELKNILGRQPGPEVQEQIVLYQGNLKDKYKQMKAMNIELEMYKEQVEEFRGDLGLIADEGRRIKKEWIAKASKQGGGGGGGSQ